MIVVSNTSPIINLAAIRRLDLLRQLYGSIAIPESVYHEIAVTDTGEAGSREVQTLDWIETKKAANRLQVAALQIELDKGEAEAISLALELKADFILLDERRGRAVASRLGLMLAALKKRQIWRRWPPLELISGALVP
jgi:predicted nucleic acid-binding protein